jgi:hypothetical protein
MLRAGVPMESGELRPVIHRSHARFPIELTLQYKLISKGRVQCLGHGRTVNISSGGILFVPDDSHHVGAKVDGSDLIELVMDWPLLLREVCMLKLVVRGELVRRDGDKFAMRLERYEFRTAGRRAAPAPQRETS